MSPQAPQAYPGFGARFRSSLFGAPGTFEGANVTRAIIWINVIVFVAELAVARTTDALMSVPASTMILFGANVAPSTVYEHHFETLVTSCFLHFSILHIGFNMVALRQIGPFVERAVGSARFAAMYVASGILGSAGSALYWLAHHESGEVRVSAGASGAICGVIGAAMILGARTQGWRSPLTQGMARWLGTIFVLGLIASFDNAAHAGGALGGSAIAALWRRGVTLTPATRRLVVIAAAVVCVGAGAVMAVRTLTDPYLTLDASARYDRTVAALSARRCAEARHGVRSLEDMPLGQGGTREQRDALLETIRQLHAAVDAHCSD